MSKLIDEDGFYAGSELKWCMEDVLRVLNEMDMTASREDVERILIASFQDNHMLMQQINEAIGDTITFMIDEGQLKTEEL
jgi:hypothetical protein